MLWQMEYSEQTIKQFMRDTQKVQSFGRLARIAFETKPNRTKIEMKTIVERMVATYEWWISNKL